MRVAAVSAMLALLAGCSVVPGEAWTYDPAHPSKATLSTQEVIALTTRVADLQLQRTQIRDRIAAEPDVWARQADYRALHRVGMELSPLERQLGNLAQAR
jgi:outer membrane murein-binding lipoprotein Lpp